MKIGNFAKALAIKNMGQNNMFKYLRNKGYLQQDNTPIQRYVNQSWFVVRQVKKGEREFSVTMLTTKGIDKIIQELIKDGYLESTFNYTVRDSLSEENNITPNIVIETLSDDTDVDITTEEDNNNDDNLATNK